jgi:hypothetical protein
MRLSRIFAFLATTMRSRDAADVWARRETEAGTTGAKLNADAPATRARTKMDLRVGKASRRAVSRSARLAEPRTLRPRNYQTHRARGGHHEWGSGRRASGARRSAPSPPLKNIFAFRADPACLVASPSSQAAKPRPRVQESCAPSRGPARARLRAGPRARGSRSSIRAARRTTLPRACRYSMHALPPHTALGLYRRIVFSSARLGRRFFHGGQNGALAHWPLRIVVLAL